MMHACYDLSKCPASYDVICWLGLVELERQKQGQDKIEIHLLPGPDRGFRRTTLWPQDYETRLKMRDKVLIPLCHMLPATQSVTIHNKRPITLKHEFGFDRYDISLIAQLKALKAGCRPLRYNGEPPEKDPKLITMTLREAEHHPLRNSNVEEWMEAAKRLEGLGYKVVIVRDTARADVILSPIATAPVASKSIPDRAFLYSLAALNLGVNNGPMWMAISMDVPVIMFRPTTNEAGQCYDDKFFKSCGLSKGSQLPTSPDYQRLVWEDDKADLIVEAVENFLGQGSAGAKERRKPIKRVPMYDKGIKAPEEPANEVGEDV